MKTAHFYLNQVILDLLLGGKCNPKQHCLAAHSLEPMDVAAKGMSHCTEQGCY